MSVSDTLSIKYVTVGRMGVRGINLGFELGSPGCFGRCGYHIKAYCLNERIMKKVSKSFFYAKHIIDKLRGTRKA